MLRLKLLVGLLWVLALLLAGWTLSQLPFGAIKDIVAALTISNWALWITINAIVLALPLLRWTLLTQAIGTTIKRRFFLSIRLAGNAVSFLTPGPYFGGEPLQLYWMYTLQKMPLHRATLSLGLDRFFELVTNISVVLGALVLLVLSSTLASDDLLYPILALVLLLLLMIGAGVLLLRQPQWLSKRLDTLAHRWSQHPRLSRIDCQWQQFGADLRNVFATQRSRLWLALLLSLLGWAALLVELLLLLHFLGLSLEPFEFILIIVAMRLAMLLPAPGGIGTIEAALLWSFQLLQLPATAAIGLIALTRLRDAIVLVIGLWCLARLQRASKQQGRA
ncbi:MAG: flippase-like domain-containing protein [Pseudomonadota bacterium]